jgi:hypothetical protein
MRRTRRRFIKLALAILTVPSATGWPATARAAPRFHIVNGWVLTDGDLAALGIDAR